MRFQTNRTCLDSKETFVSSNKPKSHFPMMPFKGTKYHIEKCEYNHKTLNSGEKRKAASDSSGSGELRIKEEKIPKYDSLQILSKLENFSDIWNDCPNVENTKSNFDIVPNHPNKMDVDIKKKNFEQKSNKKSKLEESKWPVLNGNTKSSKEESTKQTQNHLENSYVNKIKTGRKNNENDKLKGQMVDGDITVTGKYDSKVAEIKRKKAVQELSQLHADQKNIIKKALSSMDGKQQVNKKIVFSDSEDEEETKTELISKGNKTKSNKLFDDDENSSEEDLELKVNSQFEGKKGQKLLELQSKFASDSRFTLDSRFHDSESENEKEEISENLDINKEKNRQLEILESIVKQPIRPLSETKKVLGNRFNEHVMVRYDPTKEDHQRYLLKLDKSLKGKESEEKRKRSKKDVNSVSDVEESRPEVSTEKVYAVKEDLKEVLKTENQTQFSLLKLFGSKEEESNTQQTSSESIKKLKYATKNPFRYDSSDSETEEDETKVAEERQKNETKPSLPSWRTTFFFTENDSRLKEAEEFLKVPDETEGDQEFTEKRKMLKDFIRHKLKNSNRKKDPFKKKLGGVNKKVFHKKKRR